MMPAKESVNSAELRHGQYVVVQLGARMHYAVPRVLHDHDRLARLYTDACLQSFVRRAPGGRLSARLPSALRRLADRDLGPIPPDRVVSAPALAAWYWWRRRRSATPTDLTATHLWAGTAMCRKVVRRGFAGGAAVYAYNSAALEAFQAARREGLRCVLEQTIAPRAIEEQILEQERRDWPGWEDHRPDANVARFIEREREEWDLAHLIVCASPFVVEGIRRAGGPAEKCVVVPYGVDAKTPNRPWECSPADPRPGRALFVGTVGLRKGAQYLCEAARRLSRANIEVRVVGPVTLTERGRKELEAAATVVGPLPRSEIAREYEQADVFVLPTLCEGSATVCYEAMASGLPVVTTTAAGFVGDRVAGFAVAPRDSDALAERVERICRDGDLRASLRQGAFATAAENTVAAYGARLLRALETEPSTVGEGRA